MGRTFHQQTFVSFDFIIEEAFIPLEMLIIKNNWIQMYMSLNDGNHKVRNRVRLESVCQNSMHKMETSENMQINYYARIKRTVFANVYYYIDYNIYCICMAYVNNSWFIVYLNLIFA